MFNIRLLLLLKVCYLYFGMLNFINFSSISNVRYSNANWMRMVNTKNTEMQICEPYQYQKILKYEFSYPINTKKYQNLKKHTLQIPYL
jgi:hypothetical protein